MNLYDAALMEAPSLQPGHCVVCRRPYPTSHHVVLRSRGGHSGPQLHLCGHGTAGCHGRAHERRLHFRYEDGWQYLRTEQSMKYTQALDSNDWVEIRSINA